MKVLVIGASGQTGRRIIERLLETDHAPLAMIRDPSKRTGFDALGVPAVIADLEYPIDHAVQSCDAVIFAAGSGGKTGKDKTVLIDHLGAIRAAVTAAVQGASRFIMLSSLNNDVNSESAIAHYHRAKAHADHFLRDAENVLDDHLDWTIVCPGRLTTEAGSGNVRVFPEVTGDGQTSRDNLAAALVACLDEPATIGKSFGLLDGDTPVAQALASV